VSIQKKRQPFSIALAMMHCGKALKQVFNVFTLEIKDCAKINTIVFIKYNFLMENQVYVM
jgi:hypothetical protein